MTDKTIVLVTGANTGLGFEIVKALLRSNQLYHIILAGRSLGRAQEAIKLAQEEVKETKSELTALQLDLSDDESIERAFTTVQGSLPRIDVLVNNGGRFQYPLMASIYA